VGCDESAPSGEPAGADEISFGSSRPAGHWRPGRLLIVAGAVVLAAVAVVAVLVTGHGKKPPRARPAVAVTEVGHRLLGVTAGW
jgi:hypothetical protein